jgi:uncharacterized lipoprotein YddW (UPF0748 family)
LWVTRSTLTSAVAITRMVQAAHANGFNTLLVQVRGRGDAYYASRLEPRAQALGGQPSTFDPLRQTIDEARRVGLRVHAWICIGLVSSAVDLPRSRAHVVYRHPDWLMVPRGVAKDLRRIDPRSPVYLNKLARTVRQQPSDVEGIYLSPVHPGVADYLAAVVAEIVSRYAIDGVHLDYVRYPNEDFDYSQGTLARFAGDVRRGITRAEWRTLQRKMATDPFVLVDRFPEQWRDFRRERLTALVQRLRSVLKARRPAALLTAAVLPDAEEASATRMQDWHAWATRGALDAVCPMAYATDTGAFEEQVQAARRAAARVPVWAGIGAYRLTTAQTIESIMSARRLGAAGVVLFSYDSLVGTSSEEDALSEIGRAAFGPPSPRR